MLLFVSTFSCAEAWVRLGAQALHQVDRQGANPVNSEKVLYSRREAANLLSISTRTLDRLIGAKALTTRRLGSRVMVPHAELMKLSRKDTLRIFNAT